MRPTATIRHFRPQATTRRRLPVIVPHKVRIAQVGSKAVLFEEARYFSFDELAELQKYAPQVLIGSSECLLDLSKRIQQGQLLMQHVDRAVFILTDCRDVPLRDKDRVTLWQTFGVPVYELLLGGDGLLLAAECEAYEGFHVEKGITFTSLQGQLWFSTRRGYSGGTGLTGDLEEQPCPCGRVGKRLMNVALDLHDAVRYRLLATA